ncbi:MULTISPECIES: chaperone modulator CbpM [Acidithiobacillus]|jgi:chaperone modulatory protein CbpM|uniref:Transcriptional regulator, MerR family n=2 Tax=Acidithiobacillus caldus TaxID=33059 RepID=F9ZT82_ACICS|nr:MULTISPECIES: chaperone modulator CbpM [Acidithiobacillus]AEK56705.1 transcriptional regulator, MerR family [Acidithiobacillus caldus SM-1]AIA53941.1 transcriptional regulator, MerR family [Acidithiobacillus caldus ATCC 51756]AUW31619.1 MerR family transcriptional regulator [Acidithiobacillus caldus]MBU2729072.1 MerR family transcriptional regulator [Acidithiobacillus caldus]MBU2736684.1 MerR family transcriptional regulator [Acidithiobacillus caldus ATCC 51756]
MSSTPITVLQAEIVDDGLLCFDFGELCDLLHCAPSEALAWVQYGVIQPQGSGPQHWRFRRIDLYRARLGQRLARDLELDMAGAALAVELLERLRF